MGQEGVARAHYRGGNRRKLYLIIGETLEQTPIEINATVSTQFDGNLRPIGHIVSALQLEELYANDELKHLVTQEICSKTVALAILPNDLEEEITLYINEQNEYPWHRLH